MTTCFLSLLLRHTCHRDKHFDRSYSVRARVFPYIGVPFQVLTTLELVDVEVIFISKPCQSSIVRPWSDSPLFSIPPLCSATKGVQVYSHLLPSAHHANSGVQAPNR